MVVLTVFSIESAGDGNEEYDAKGQEICTQDLIPTSSMQIYLKEN